MTILPAFFRASVYALAAACFGAVCRVAFGADLDPFTVFCLTAGGYLAAVAIEPRLMGAFE